jgi:hypothetical protein
VLSYVTAFVFIGEGRLITICDVDSPPAYPVMVHMNFKKEALSPLSSLNWSTAQEDYTSSEYHPNTVFFL